MQAKLSLFVAVCMACVVFVCTPNAVSAQSPWPFDAASTSILRASPRKVFAHYVPVFPLSVDNIAPATDYYQTQWLSPTGENDKHLYCGGYIRERTVPQNPLQASNWQVLNMETEVKHAIAIGLDGFSVDITATSGQFYTAIVNLLTAAHAVDPGFSILLVPDMGTLPISTPGAVKGVIESLGAYPAAMHLSDGSLAIAPFSAESEPASWWTTLLQQLGADGVKVSFIPMFLSSWQQYATAYAPISAGFSSWGVRDPQTASESEHTQEAAGAHKYVPIWMAPVAPQDTRPKSANYYEMDGSLGYQTLWNDAIAGGADWVQMVTWNDYSEGTDIEPSTKIGCAFYDLTAYYINWFKLGKAPPITRDVLYYFHRTQPTSASTANLKNGETPFALRGATGVSNAIEVLAFLTAPGVVSITIGPKTYTGNAPAGMSAFTAPLAPGTPSFNLSRNGKSVLSFSSTHVISNTVVHWDMLYAAGCSSRGGG